MAKVAVNESSLVSACDAIREKLGVQTTYMPSEMADAIASISGGGGVPLLTRAEWNDLTTAQKRSQGVIGIVDATTGFSRGVLVNGADYKDVADYLPSSNSGNVGCLASYDNFFAERYAWGQGANPINATSSLIRYQNEEAVYFNARAGNNIGVTLDSTTSDFTVYVVAKGLQYNSGDTIILGSVYSFSRGNEITLYHRSGTMWRSSVYASDEDLIDTQGDYVAVAIRSASMMASWFAHDGSERKGVSYNAHGTKFMFGGSGTTYDVDLAVKFVGYVNEAETDAQIAANLANLATMFELS